VPGGRTGGGRGEQDPGDREGEDGRNVPSSSQPLLDPPEKRRVDPRQDQKDDDGGEEREQLGSLPQGPDEERLDFARGPPHGEFDRDLGQKQSEAERAQDQGDDQRPASRDR